MNEVVVKITTVTRFLKPLKTIKKALVSHGRIPICLVMIGLYPQLAFSNEAEASSTNPNQMALQTNEGLTSPQDTPTSKTMYVSDELNIALRTGDSNQHRIIRFLKSGTKLSVRDTSTNQNWHQVQLANSTETGWVRANYLSDEPSARERLAQSEAKLERLTRRLKTSKSSAQDAQTQILALNAQIDELTQTHKALKEEYASLKALSENALNLDQENRNLKSTVSDHQMLIDELQTINSILRSDQRNEGIYHGALAVLLGVIITLVVPRLFRRQSRDYWG